jgi:flavin reductase (DIM6/NTAB) family NADH-FMN oxidoreductase RutF
MKNLLSAGKCQVLRLANYPWYGAVGLRDPQERVKVWLNGFGDTVDVTRNNVVAALRPFTIGVMLASQQVDRVGQTPELRIEDERLQPRLLGRIRLRLTRTITLPDHRFCLFESAGSENFSASAAGLRLYYWQEQRRARSRRRKDPYNFQMAPADLRAMHVFYICPRPVVLVSVKHEDAGNLFPMDLIGPTGSPWFSMALRNTSPAVRLMQSSRRMALASIPFSWKEIAYQLAKHHKARQIDWGDLPFDTTRSLLFGLNVPREALRVREVRVHEFHEVGSHTLFLTAVERETIPEGSGGPQLFHVFGSYRR